MNSHIKKVVLACFLASLLSTSAHAAHEYSQKPILSINSSTQVSEHSHDQNPYTDEIWLFGSFLVSLTGLVILVRFLHH